MSSPRPHRCLRGRTITFCFIITSVVGLYFLYTTQEKSIEVIKSQQSKCLNEQASLFWRLREETEAKNKALLTLSEGKKIMTELTQVHAKEKVVLKNQIDKLQNELEVLKLECSKYEKQAQEQHFELEKNKLSLSVSQRQLNSELMTKDHVIDVLKQDKKDLTDMLRKVQGRKQFPFYYPQPRVNVKNVNKQVDLGNDIYIIENDVDKVPINKRENYPSNLNPFGDVLTPKASTTSISVKHKSADKGVLINGSAHIEPVRPIVPNGFAPELIVNDEKQHKSGDYLAKPDGISDELKKNERKNMNEVKPPNRYKAKVDKNDKKFDEVKIEDDSMRKFPLKAPYSEDKQDVFHFGEDHNAFDNINKNHVVEDNNVNDVNISLDQAEPGLHAEEEYDDDDDFEKANFPHQPGNMN